MALELTPVTLRETKHFVDRCHRHHRAPQGGKFAVGVAAKGEVVGVAIVGRPVARNLDNGYVAEVTRVCVLEGHKNANSMLYAACWRAARAMGYRLVVTYTGAGESGSSLIAAGYTYVGQAGGGSWDRPSRPRVDTHPVEQKTLWQRA